MQPNGKINFHTISIMTSIIFYVFLVINKRREIHFYNSNRFVKGSNYCGACKNCKYCKYCSVNGGSCGVCK